MHLRFASSRLQPTPETNDYPSSVGSLSSKGFYRSQNTIRQYLTSHLTLPPGMLMENSACIQHTQSNLSDHRQRSSAANSVTTPTRCARSMRQNHCQEKLPPPPAVKQRPRRKHQTQKQLKKTWATHRSTLRRTKFTRLVTMPIILNSSAPQTAFPHNRSVQFPPKLPLSQPELFTAFAKQGELEHRRVKRFYKRTNKTRFERQIAKHERMERHYRKYVNTLRDKTGGRTTSRAALPMDPTDDASPRQHYSIAKRDRDHVDIYSLAHRHAGDPALKVGGSLCWFPQSH